jgi:hypothetical protein
MVSNASWLYVFCVLFVLCVMCLMLPVSLDCRFLIDASVVFMRKSKLTWQHGTKNVKLDTECTTKNHATKKYRGWTQWTRTTLVIKSGTIYKRWVALLILDLFTNVICVSWFHPLPSFRWGQCYPSFIDRSGFDHQTHIVKTRWTPLYANIHKPSKISKYRLTSSWGQRRTKHGFHAEIKADLTTWNPNLYLSNFIL